MTSRSMDIGNYVGINMNREQYCSVMLEVDVFINIYGGGMTAMCPLLAMEAVCCGGCCQVLMILPCSLLFALFQIMVNYNILRTCPFYHAK